MIKKGDIKMNLGRITRNEVALLSVIGLGVYAQANGVNLANNTGILLLLLLALMGGDAIGELQDETFRSRRRLDSALAAEERFLI
jgi:hypothetical protein